MTVHDDRRWEDAAAWLVRKAARVVAGLLALARDRRAVTAEAEADDTTARPHDPGRPAEVERHGALRWAVCPVCPWEGGDRLVHFDAVADAAHHNDAVHCNDAVHRATALAAAVSESGQPGPGHVVHA